jgi:hypothetical protein
MPAQPRDRRPGQDYAHISDRSLYDQIVEDATQRAGIHTLEAAWRPDSLFPDAPDAQCEPTFEALLPAWLGPKTLADADDRYVESCRSFLQRLGLPTERFDKATARAAGGRAAQSLNPLRLDALRTLVEIELVWRALPAGHEPVKILEVGGGYGRLCEAAMKLATRDVRYILVDAVPASIYYAYAYLSERLPQRSVGLCYLDPDSSGYDCYITPPWRLAETGETGFQLAINIASFQEMSEEQVWWYLSLFDGNLVADGRILLANSRDYVYPRVYEYPLHWRLELKEHYPFSWSPDYPVEVLTKAGGDCSSDNARIDLRYLETTTVRYRGRVEELRESVARTGASHAAARERLNSKIGRLETSVEAAKSRAQAERERLLQRLDVTEQNRVRLRDELVAQRERLLKRQAQLEKRLELAEAERGRPRGRRASGGASQRESA